MFYFLEPGSVVAIHLCLRRTLVLMVILFVKKESSLRVVISGPRKSSLKMTRDVSCFLGQHD